MRDMSIAIPLQYFNADPGRTGFCMLIQDILHVTNTSSKLLSFLLHNKLELKPRIRRRINFMIRLEFEARQGQHFSLFHSVQTGSEAHQAPIQWALDLTLPYLSRTVRMYMPEGCSPA
jgi:hypothetical protein